MVVLREIFGLSAVSAASQSRSKFLPLVLAALAAAGAAVSLPARADDQALALKVEALTQRVRILEQTVKQLQSSCAAPTAAANSSASAPSPSPSPRPEAGRETARGPDGQIHAEPGHIKESWLKLERHMSGGQVEHLLGQPSRKLAIDGKTLWYYDYGDFGSGSVMLRNGHVLDWQRPTHGLFW